MALVEVSDDGVGGADRGRGTGLRGLVDRLEALDGHLAVESPWLTFYLFVLGVPPPTILLLPIVIIEMVLLTITIVVTGITWRLRS